MNVGALLIFGKVVAWIILVVSVFLLGSGIWGVAEHNRNKVAVMWQGEASLRMSVVLTCVVLIIVSLGFIAGTWGVSG